MAQMLYDGLVSWLGQMRRKVNERDMLTYAKTEYKDDWQYAYHYMLSHNGQGPSTGVRQ